MPLTFCLTCCPFDVNSVQRGPTICAAHVRPRKKIEMRKKLTDQLLRSLKPPVNGRTVITDTERAGLRFRMTTSGSASFLLEKKIKGGRRRAFTLGTYPNMSLAAARAEALRIEIEAQAGVDRIEADKAPRNAKAADEIAARSVEDILAIYISNHIERNLKEGPAREERKRQLRTSLSKLNGTRMDRLSRADLQSIVDSKASEGKIVMANRIRAALCAFTRWAFRRGHIVIDPGANVQKAGREVSRKRTPSLHEVREIWAASFECGPLWGPYFRMCILTGQRSREAILRMQWSWVNLEKKRLEIPMTKNGEPHIVHFSEPALAQLAKVQDHQNAEGIETPFVFTTTGVTAASGVSRAKLRLDAKIGENRRKQGVNEAIEHWVLHDLRRSHATALGEAGLSEGVVDRIQNHVAVGSRPSAVAAVYALAKMLPERARAMDLWATMVTEQSGHLVELHATAP